MKFLPTKILPFARICSFHIDFRLVVICAGLCSRDAGLSISFQRLCTVFTLWLLSVWKSLSVVMASASAVRHPTGFVNNMAAPELMPTPTGPHTHPLNDSVSGQDAWPGYS